MLRRSSHSVRRVRSASLLDRAWTWATTPHRLVGCALLRIGLGTVVFIYYANEFAIRHYLWSADGIYDLGTYDRFRGLAQSGSVFAVRSTLMFDLLYVAGMFTAALFAAGIWRRTSSLLFLIFAWSLFSRNPLVLSGGDNVIQVTLPYLIFLDTTRVLSVRRYRERRRQPTLPSCSSKGAVAPLEALAHNAALLCILIQLGIVYGTSAIYKLLGAPWRGGNALEQILRVPEFSGSWAAHVIVGHPLIAGGITYGVVLFEAAYPFMMWARRYRVFAAGGAVLLHAGIALVMGLVLFGFTMIVFQTVLLSDLQYEQLGKWAGSVRQGLTIRLRDHHIASGTHID